MNEIRVTWQLALFVVAAAGFPISLAPVFTAVERNGFVTSAAARNSAVVAAALVALMAVAVWSRFRQAAHERRPDGRPMPRWILRQVLIGTLLCAAGACVLAGLAWLKAPRELVGVGSALVAGPGILLIARVLSPVR